MPTKIATLADLSFVDALAKKHANALGFLPRPALEWYAGAGRIRLTFENDQPAGYVLGREKFRWAPLMRPITQAAICFDAQRRHLGLELIKATVADAIEAKQIGVQCMCAEDLEANAFWLAAGFVKIGQYAPNNARGREIICWRKPLTKRLPLWFANLPPVAGHRGRSVPTTTQFTSASAKNDPTSTTVSRVML